MCVWAHYNLLVIWHLPFTIFGCTIGKGHSNFKRLSCTSLRIDISKKFQNTTSGLNVSVVISAVKGMSIPAANLGFPRWMRGSFVGRTLTYYFGHYFAKLHKIENNWTEKGHMALDVSLNSSVCRSLFSKHSDLGFIQVLQFLILFPISQPQVRWNVHAMEIWMPKNKDEKCQCPPRMGFPEEFKWHQAFWKHKKFLSENVNVLKTKIICRFRHLKLHNVWQMYFNHTQSLNIFFIESIFGESKYYNLLYQCTIIGMDTANENEIYKQVTYFSNIGTIAISFITLIQLIYVRTDMPHCFEMKICLG